MFRCRLLILQERVQAFSIIEGLRGGLRPKPELRGLAGVLPKVAPCTALRGLITSGFPSRLVPDVRTEPPSTRVFAEDPRRMQLSQSRTGPIGELPSLSRHAVCWPET
jgi:hypothetical protein